MEKQHQVLTLDEWKKKGEEIFGTADVKKWRFKCPSCGNTQTFEEFTEKGFSKEEASGVFYFSCIGRYDKKQGCDYTSGGLFCLADTYVVSEEGREIPVFEFATEEAKVPHKKFIE